MNNIDKLREANERIAALEAQSERRRQLLEASDARVNRLSDQVDKLKAQLADMRELAYERGPKLAAEELRRQQEMYEAQLTKLRAALEKDESERE